MRIAHVSSEVAPYSQTGGLAQVVSALPRTLAELDGGTHKVAIFSPLYRSVYAALQQRNEQLGERECAMRLAFGYRWHHAYFRTLHRPSAPPIHFLDCPELFDREGIYGEDDGDFDDNAERFSILCRAVLEGCERLMAGAPQIIHCHDWQTGLLPLLLRTHRPDLLVTTRTVFTIHNLAYQGCFPKTTMKSLALPWSAFTFRGLEFYDKVSTLKAGIAFADVTTTVSENYAREIRTTEFGCGLEGFLTFDCPQLVGICNGIDVEQWNPASDSFIAERFDASHLDGKRHCRNALLSEYGLTAEPSELLVGVVSRLADQKGLDLIADLVPELHAMSIRLIVVGNGDAQLEDRFKRLAGSFGKHLAVYIGFDEGRAHRVFAGADAFLMPSRFEPCGLGQMAAMRYGTVPIVHAVGGLRDTVEDPGDTGMRTGMGNGFVFQDASPIALREAMVRAARIYRDEAVVWRRLAQRCMALDWSWTVSARRYLELYREA